MDWIFELDSCVLHTLIGTNTLTAQQHTEVQLTGLNAHKEQGGSTLTAQCSGILPFFDPQKSII